MNRIAKTLIFSTIITLATSQAATAIDYEKCLRSDKTLTGLSTISSEKYPIKCVQVRMNGGEYVQFYAATNADCASVGSIASDPEFCADEVTNTAQDQTTETKKTNRVDETKNETTEPENDKETNLSPKTTEPENDKEANLLPIILATTGGLLFIAIIIAVITLISKSKKTTNLNPTYPIAQDESTTYDNQNQQNSEQ